MIYPELFLSFLKVGAVSFGGGYGMISILQDEVLLHGWMTKDAFLNFVAVAESTPGPIAVNMATFIGSSQAGVPGAALATLGVITPAFIIILLVAAALRNLMKYAGVNGVLKGIRPCVAGLVTATGFLMFLSKLFGLTSLSGGFSVDFRAIAVFLLLAGLSVGYKKLLKKRISPILLILFSAGLGMLFYGVLK